MRNEDTGGRLRVLELFCGIGGASAAIGDAAAVACAIDLDRTAVRVYRKNFAHPAQVRSIESLREGELRAFDAGLWWMSPPCQPHTSRGLQRDLDDPRSRALGRLIELLPVVRPPRIALENVPPFAHSNARDALVRALDRAGYEWREIALCPTSLGVPNRRERYYLVASTGRLSPWPEPRADSGRTVADLLDEIPDESLFVDPRLARRFWFALDRVDPRARDATLSCFTGGYGHSVIRSGSYIETARGLRRLSPAEILRALGFPSWFSFPDDLSRRRVWRLLGNSLSVPAVRHVLAAFPELAPRPIEREASRNQKLLRSSVHEPRRSPT